MGAQVERRAGFLMGGDEMCAECDERDAEDNRQHEAEVWDGVDADGVPFVNCVGCGTKLRKDAGSSVWNSHGFGHCRPSPLRTPAEEAVIRAAVEMRANNGYPRGCASVWEKRSNDAVDALLAAQPEWGVRP